MNIRPAGKEDLPAWLALRQALWAEGTREAHLAEMREFLDAPARFAQYIAYDDDDRTAIGFAEASRRQDYVAGTSSSPVAYLEGIYVIPAARGRGVARALVDEVTHWGIAMGCKELASDTELENIDSQGMHQALGFAEAERIVCYVKPIAD